MKKVSAICSMEQLAQFPYVFQFRVSAYDLGGIHTRNTSSAASVTVTVDRNKNAPKFEGEPFKKTIAQTQGSGSNIYRVQARDRDSKAPFNTIQYELIGDDKGPSYFTCNAKNGEIQVRSGVDLPRDKEITYTVSHHNALMWDFYTMF